MELALAMHWDSDVPELGPLHELLLLVWPGLLCCLEGTLPPQWTQSRSVAMGEAVTPDTAPWVLPPAERRHSFKA